MIDAMIGIVPMTYATDVQLGYIIILTIYSSDSRDVYWMHIIIINDERH